MDTMKAAINRRIFAQSIFDSGALNVLASVVHQFKDTGTFDAEVACDGGACGRFTLLVDPASTILQLKLDLSTHNTIRAPRKDGPNDSAHCRCESNEADPARKNLLYTIAPGAFVVFHASSGAGGYSVTVGTAKEKTRIIAFDSQKLSADDLFAVSLLEPTSYAMVDRKAKGTLEVVYTRAHATQLRSLPTLYVNALGDRFDPNKIELVSTQGLVFRIHGTGARIVIEKTGT